MANEWWHNHKSGYTLYLLLRKKTNNEVFDEADGGDTWEAWQDGNVANYDVPLVDRGGDYYSVDMPSAITTPGIYRGVIKRQVGGVPHATDDIVLAQGEQDWSGSSENIVRAGGRRVS